MTRMSAMRPPTRRLVANMADRGALSDHNATSRGAVALSAGLLSHAPYSVTKASNVFGIGSELPFANYWTRDGGLPEVLSVLPPKTQADALLARYFECVDAVYPMIHRQTFYADYEHFWQLGPAGRDGCDAAFAGLILVMLALGAQFIVTTGLDERKQTAEFYASAANQALRVASYLSSASLRSIQAMVLLTYFLINDNHASDGWAFSGILIRQAYAMGLHRDPNIGKCYSILSTSLLQRARLLASEHDKRQEQLNASFQAENAKRVGEIARVASALRAWEKAHSSIQELTAMASADADLAAIARQELETEQSNLALLERNLATSLTPRHAFADMPCMLEFRPGPGGLEGRYFTDALFKMYQALCLRRGYDSHVLKYELSDAAGDVASPAGELPLQEAVLEVRHQGAYEIFRSEAGMHRVQRVPSTDSRGRVHTSAAAVWVLPSNLSKESDASDDTNGDFHIDPCHVRVETMRARGAGGQNVNKTESAVRLTHLPSGITVSMQDHRSQPRNRDAAWTLLRARLASHRAEKREADASALRSSILSQAQITRGDKMRTYNFNQDRCTDHRSAFDVHNLPNVLAGGEFLDRIMEAARNCLVDREVQMAAALEEEKATTKKRKKGQDD
ncbi:hypothetical protein CDD82_7339 [Ophiocordyceps australis]|uniref:Prokaryotic-type class I peptide chain release factors domain-containing protein n=1 Tax=Ophiocordyceps australis TaxID=1399860 RepID=A0A2C5YRG8_9HYPO|nr:hypothetical protein CDD82_7339 [Ophiocordyceps australis]